MKFRDYYNSIEELPKCHSVIEREIFCFRVSNEKFWKDFEQALIAINDSLTLKLKEEYQYKTRDLLELLTIFKNTPSNNLCRQMELNLGKQHQEETAIKVKEEIFQESLKKLQKNIYQTLPLAHLSELPLFYVDQTNKINNFQKPPPPTVIPEQKDTEHGTQIDDKSDSKAEGNEDEDKAEETPFLKEEGEARHLIFLCHGLQGNRKDMKKIKWYISEFIPNSICHLSSANENKQDCELYLMGRRLAEEIKDVYKECASKYHINAISFVGHFTGNIALIPGGLIIRSAIEYIPDLTHLLETYISVSTPHLGILEKQDSIVNKSLGVVTGAGKLTSVKELYFKDSQNMREAYLYKLADSDSLTYFKKILLMHGSSDPFAPYYSSRLQTCHGLK